MAASLAENLCCCARIETEQRMAFQSSASVRLRLSNPHLVTAPHRPVLPPGSSLASCGKSPAARRNQDGPTTPPKRNSAAGTALGTQLEVTSMARGLLGSRALTRRSSPNETCRIKRREKVNMCRNAKHIYSSYLFALLMGFSRGASDLPSGRM